MLWWPYRAAGWKLLAGAATYSEKWRNNESLYALLLDASGQEALAHIGLGNAEKCDVVVTWGKRQKRLEGVTTNRIVAVRFP